MKRILTTARNGTNAVFGRRPRCSTSESKSRERQRLVILGSGWGGYSLMKNIDQRKFSVVVVSPRNHFLFTPLLASTTVGTLEFRSIIEPVRYGRKFRDERDFHLAEAERLDLEEKTVWCRSMLDESNRYAIRYDKLVIAVGALSNTFGVPGVREHAFFLKELVDAKAIRNRIISNFELAVQPGVTPCRVKQLLHFVIVGGGPTGVEFGAELYDFISQDMSRLFPMEVNDVRVSLIEASQILSGFDEKLRKFAEKKIQQREKMELVKGTVSEVHRDTIILQDRSEIPCGLVVWAAGLAPRSFVLSLGVPKNKQQQLLVDQSLRLKADPMGSVFALGDCSCVEENPMPPTAQVAERQGRYLAKSLSQYSDATHSPPMHFKSVGMLAYVGDYQAVAELPQFKFGGFHSWLLWRSAYLTRLGNWRLRLQVPIDWFKTFFYGRDVSQF